MSGNAATTAANYQVTFDEADKSLLVRILRVAFPHDSFPDGPYERTATTMLEQAGESLWYSLVLKKGLVTLQDVDGTSFNDLDVLDATRVLHRVQTTEFFGFIRRTAVLTLYDHEDVWELLGYEGPSFDQGGYLQRGFDDLDWLPEPQVEMPPAGQEWRDVCEPFAGQRTPPPHFSERDTVTQPGRTAARSGEVRK